MPQNTVTETAPVAVDFDMPAPGTEGYEDWRKTGKLPSSEESAPPEKDEAQQRSDELDAAEAAEIAAAEEKPTVTRATPVVAKPQGKKKTGDERFQELANTNREIANANRELRERIAALETRGSQPAEVKRETAAPQPAAEQKAKPKLTDHDPKTGKPFATLEAWNDAVDDWRDAKYNQNLTQELTKAQQNWQQTETDRIIAQETQRRSEPAMKKHADFLATVTNPRLLIPAGSTVQQFLLNPDTQNPGEIVYHLGKHPEILEDFYQWEGTLEKGSYKNKLDPIKQLRFLVELERELSATPEAKPVTPARISQAPRVPHQVTGKAPAPDSMARAVEDGDQATFTRLANEAALAKRKAAGRR